MRNQRRIILIAIGVVIGLIIVAIGGFLILSNGQKPAPAPVEHVQPVIDDSEISEEEIKIIKPIDDLLEKGTGFLGVEDSHLIACGVWYEPQPKSYLAEKMLEFYQSQEHFDKNNLFKMSIPRIMTRILNELGLDHTSNEIQYLKHNIQT